MRRYGRGDTYRGVTREPRAHGCRQDHDVCGGSLRRAGRAVTPAQSWVGDPGAALRASSLWVTNTGNCGDTFALSAAGPWAVTLPPTTGAVQAGGRITVPVTVTIPVAALAGEAAVTTLKATSQAGPRRRSDCAADGDGERGLWRDACTGVGSGQRTGRPDGRLHAHAVQCGQRRGHLCPDGGRRPVGHGHRADVCDPGGRRRDAGDRHGDGSGRGRPPARWTRRRSRRLAASATSHVTTAAAAGYGVILDAAVTAGETPAGRTITYTVWVTNTGDYTDTFDLTVAGNTWPVTLSQDSVFPGAQAGTVRRWRCLFPQLRPAADSDTTTSRRRPGEMPARRTPCPSRRRRERASPWLWRGLHLYRWRSRW